MVAVLVAFTIAMVAMLGSLVYLTASTKYSRVEQDSDRALAAAESGLNDLLARLRLDPGYLEDMVAKAGDAASYCRHPATGGPTGDKDLFAKDCGWDANADIEWDKVGGSDSVGQYYHLAVTAYWPASRTVEVMATGKSQKVVRSLKASIAPETTPLWLYFSNYELSDPTDPITYPPGPTGDGYYGGSQLTSGACGGYGAGGAAAREDLTYAWKLKEPGNKKPARVYSSLTAVGLPCKEPTFEGWDSLNGPVHSNDTIRANKSEFLGEFSTADPACQAATSTNELSWQKCVAAGGSAKFSQAPKHSPVKDMPSIASAAAESGKGTGCFYQGPTRVIFEGGGKMRVWSKQTEAANARAACGDPGALASDGGALVDVPADGLIFVAEAPKAGHTQIPAGGIGGPNKDGYRLPLGNYSAGMKPLPGAKYTAERVMMRQDQFADLANLYVEGELSGRVTLAAQGTIVVTGDLLTADDSQDLMGLSASTIEIYNPVTEDVAVSCLGGASNCMWTTPSNAVHQAGKLKDYDGRPEVLTIEAALHASDASFRLQNWKDGGKLGLLEVKGSIAQMFRGVVAWEEDSGALISGFEKSYSYNEQLREGSPLLFGPIENGTWVIRWLEKVTPADRLKG
ncbi:MAG: hypothetical protein LBG11_09620 [Bifidobacteriaceae bacterium]|nr:hypothetical protein [Bifidobacteriaceae bacterium]